MVDTFMALEVHANMLRLPHMRGTTVIQTLPASCSKRSDQQPALCSQPSFSQKRSKEHVRIAAEKFEQMPVQNRQEH
jgi:hypothetical protein